MLDNLPIQQRFYVANFPRKAAIYSDGPDGVLTAAQMRRNLAEL